MGSFPLLVFAKSFMWQHRKAKCACKVKKNHTEGFTYSWKANEKTEKSSENVTLLKLNCSQLFLFRGKFLV